MTQNIIFKGILLLQIYITLHKKNENTIFAPFRPSKPSNVDGHFSNATQILAFFINIGLFQGQKRLKFKKYYFLTFVTEEMYNFHTSIIKNIFRAIVYLIIFMTGFVTPSFTISDTYSYHIILKNFWSSYESHNSNTY